VVEVKSPYQIILLPKITERSLHLAAESKYTFVVAEDATKIDIKRAIETHYNKGRDKIKVVGVNPSHVRGKVRTATRLRKSGHSPKWKKAIVTLEKGQKLPDFGV
jgi:large subunit ribosomal protein L23